MAVKGQKWLYFFRGLYALTVVAVLANRLISDGPRCRLGVKLIRPYHFHSLPCTRHRPRRGLEGQRKVSVQVEERAPEPFRIIFKPQTVEGNEPPVCSSVAAQGNARGKLFCRTFAALSPRRGSPAAPSVEGSASAGLAPPQGRPTPACGGGRAVPTGVRAGSPAGLALGPRSTLRGPLSARAPGSTGPAAGAGWAAGRPSPLPRAPALWRPSRDAGGSSARQWERTSRGDADVALPRWRRVRLEQPGRGEASEAE